MSETQRQLCCPVEIGNLTNLQTLYLNDNNLTNLHLSETQRQLRCPVEIGNLTNLPYLFLRNNQLTKIPVDILKIKNSLAIDETSYEINNMDNETEIIFFTNLNEKITNLPVSIKEIWIREGIDESLIKIPFGCKIMYFD